MKARRQRILIGLVVALASVAGIYSLMTLPSQAPQNLQVLSTDEFRTVQEVKRYMRRFKLGLGVECAYCHNEDDFASDEKATKKTARRHLKLLTFLNREYFQLSEEPISCYTCHRGSTETRNTPPGW